MLIQHNPNEGLKPGPVRCKPGDGRVLIQHNPNEGLKLERSFDALLYSRVLIQHNPNEGLKPGTYLGATYTPARCSFSTTRTRD